MTEGMSKGAAVAGGERGKGMGCGSHRGSLTPFQGGVCELNTIFTVILSWKYLPFPLFSAHECTVEFSRGCVIRDTAADGVQEADVGIQLS